MFIMRIHYHRPASSAWPKNQSCVKKERDIKFTHHIAQLRLVSGGGGEGVEGEIWGAWRNTLLSMSRRAVTNFNIAYIHIIQIYAVSFMEPLEQLIDNLWQMYRTAEKNLRKKKKKKKNQPTYWITDNPLTTIQQQEEQVVLLLCLKWARKEWPHNQSLQKIKLFFFNPTNPGAKLQPNLNLKGLYQGHSISSQRANPIIHSLMEPVY